MGKAVIAGIIVVVVLVMALAGVALLENARTAMATKCDILYDVGTYIYAKEILENMKKKLGANFAGGQVHASGDDYSNDVEYCWYKYR